MPSLPSLMTVFLGATRYVVLTLMKVILVCERSALEPFLPDMVSLGPSAHFTMLLFLA